jgi:uncharacterized integral membrane protein
MKIDETPQLDRLDETMVRMYRGGLIIAAAAVLASGLSHLLFGGVIPHAIEAGGAWVQLVWVVLVYGVGMAVLNVHLYSKRARWGVQGAAWLGVLLMLAAFVMASPAGSWWVLHIGLAFVFAALSGLVVMEQASLRVPGLQAVPVCLGAALVPLVGEWWIAAGLLLTVAGVLLGVVAIAKYRVPLHLDVGDKTRYQV